MKFIDEYRSAETVHQFAQLIAQITTKPWTIMEVCGGQTHAIVKFGVDELLHDPGCPVCVTAVDIAAHPEMLFTSFGDMSLYREQTAIYFPQKRQVARYEWSAHHLMRLKSPKIIYTSK